MRRWNGWGDEATNYPLPASAARYLEGLIGEGRSAPDVTFERAIAGVGASRLAPHPAIRADSAERFNHAHGQSLRDWVSMRSGCFEPCPDGVAYPASDLEVRAWFDYARQSGARIIPYGGGTSVTGHVTPRAQDGPTLTLDLSSLNRLIDLAETSR